MPNFKKNKSAFMMKSSPTKINMGGALFGGGSKYGALNIAKNLLEDDEEEKKDKDSSKNDIKTSFEESLKSTDKIIKNANKTPLPKKSSGFKMKSSPAKMYGKKAAPVKNYKKGYYGA